MSIESSRPVLPVEGLLFSASWPELESLLDAHEQEMLSDAMDGVLAVVHHTYHNSPPFRERLEAVRQGLDDARCERQDGTSRRLSTYLRTTLGEGGPYHDLVKPDGPSVPRLFDDPAEQLAFEVTLAFTMSSSWWVRRHIVSAYPPLFTSGRAERFLAAFESREEDASRRVVYGHLRDAVRRGLAEGFDEAFACAPPAFFTRMREHPLLTVDEARQLALLAFVQCPAWERRREILERHKDLLVSDDVAGILEAISQHVPERDRDAVASARVVLAAARREGSSNAFRQPLPPIRFKGGLPAPTLFDRSRDGDALPERISYCRRAVHALDRSLAPRSWAACNIALCQWLLGSRDPELQVTYEEEALLRVYDALEIFEPAGEEWCEAQEYLGRIYLTRKRGDRSANIETAIASLEAALRVRREQGAHHQAARVAARLSEAFLSRLSDVRAANVDRAYEYGRAALGVFVTEGSRPDIAWVAQTLAAASLERIGGEGAASIDEAIELLTRVTNSLAEPDDPVQWAAAHQKLGAVYARRRGAEARDYEKALQHLTQARRVFSEDAWPWHWAWIEATMGSAAFRLGRSDAGAHAIAVEHYRKALRVFEPDVFPADRRGVLVSLGAVLFAEQLWAETARVLEEAIQLGDYLQGVASTPEARLAEIAELPDAYERLAFCLVRLGRHGQAFAAFDAGKTRLLREELPEVAGAGVPAELRAELGQALVDLRRLDPDALRRRLEDHAGLAGPTLAVESLRRAAVQRVRRARQAIAERHADWLRERLSVDQILALVPEGGALVAPLLTSQGSVLFFAIHGSDFSEANVVTLEGVTDETLRELFEGASGRAGWMASYARWLRACEALARVEADRASAQRDTAVEEARAEYDAATAHWDETIDYTCRRLWDLLAGPIYHWLAERVPEGAHVVVVPSKWLPLLPLHAAWREADSGRRYFIDDYVISYAPSGFALAASLRRVHERAGIPPSLLAVSNPTGDLAHAAAEVKAIAAQFPAGSARILEGPGATPADLVSATGHQTHLHFACHAAFNWLDPLASAVSLAGGVRFTVRDIIARLSLDRVRLVTVSACESGVIESERAPSEFLGFAAALLQAGAPCVISSLWAVDDEATASLMKRFYLAHIGEDAGPAAALRRAQLDVKAQSRTAQPYFWAAFTVVGT